MKKKPAISASIKIRLLGDNKYMIETEVVKGTSLSTLRNVIVAYLLDLDNDINLEKEPVNP